VRNNCFDILNDDLDFAKQIYVDFVGCPLEGWNKNKTCTGKYANNFSYSTDTTCTIGACWRGGWNDLGSAIDFDVSQCEDLEYLKENLAECEDAMQLKTLESFLADSLENYKNNNTGRTSVGVIPLMCGFVPLAESAAEAKSHLESLASNTIPELVELHYFDQGRYDGRPYKYCNGHGGEPRDRDKHASAKQASGQPPDQFYYDYSAYLFCLEESDWIIYTTTENK
jgi:hypothetical protein